MSIRSMFFNAIQSGNSFDRTYSAEDFSGWLDKLVGDGVFATPADNLQVKAQSTPDMTVYVNPGQGWIKGHKFISTEAIVLNVDASSSSADRYDSVMFYLDYENREMGVRLAKGEFGEPQPPAPIQTENVFWEYRLGVVKVYANTSSINQSLITDSRGSSVCPWVTGLIQITSTEALFAQYQAAFDDWFETIQAQATSAITGVTQLKNTFTPSGALSSFSVTTYIPTFNTATDVLDIYINGLRLNGNEYSRSGNTVTLTNSISAENASATAIELVVWHFTTNQ